MIKYVLSSAWEGTTAEQATDQPSGCQVHNWTSMMTSSRDFYTVNRRLVSHNLVNVFTTPYREAGVLLPTRPGISDVCNI